MKPSVENVYLDYTQQELDRAYDQSAWAPDMMKTLDYYSEISSDSRKIAQPRALHYADDAMGKVDVFHADAAGPLIYFVHGGAWKTGDRSMYSFMAQHVSLLGCPFAVPDFPKIQTIGLPAMLERVGQGLRAVLAAFPQYVDRGVIIAGHSSGAHLAACLAVGAAGADIRQVMQGCLLVSGIYDLEPVLLSSRREYVSLEDGEAKRLSPILFADGLAGARVSLLYGSGESPEFIRQTKTFGQAASKGGAEVQMQMLDGYDHFSILLDVLQSDSRIREAFRSLVTQSAYSSTGHADDHSQIIRETL